MDLVKRPLTLEKLTGPESLSSSRADQISRIWQAIAFIEEVREGLNRAAAPNDPVALALTASTHQLQIAAGILQPKGLIPHAVPDTGKDRREARA